MPLVKSSTAQSASFMALAADQHDPSVSPSEAAAVFGRLTIGNGVLLAVSGGPDSLAMMTLFADWRSVHQPDLVTEVATVDHGLRPEARHEAEMVASWARDLGFTHHMLVAEEIDADRNVQDQARRERYRLLAECATERGLSAIMTAHHLDDQAETVLIRLGRGAGVDGLTAMSSDTMWPGIHLLRPFLDVPKSRLVASLDVTGQRAIEDPSNDLERFQRGRLRKLMPALAREGITTDRLAATARRMQRARAALERFTSDHLDRVSVIDAGGFATVDPGALLDAPEEIALRALSRLVRAIGGSTYPQPLDRVERLLARIGDTNTRFAGATLGGCRIVPERRRLLFVRELGRARSADLHIEPGQSAVYDNRFAIAIGEDVPGPVDVRALGVSGWSGLADDGARRALPAVAGRTLIGFFDGDRLVAAPHADGQSDPAVDMLYQARFLGLNGVEESDERE